MKRDWTAPRAKVDEEARCRVCGSTVRLEAAHIIPRSQVAPGPGEDPRNIVPLCARCHADVHALRLELLPVLTLDEQAYVAGLVGIARAQRMTTIDRGRAA